LPIDDLIHSHLRLIFRNESKAYQQLARIGWNMVSGMQRIIVTH